MAQRRQIRELPELLDRREFEAKLVGANNLGLASRLDEGMSDKAIQVKNVKNVTQLPLTGAMGTALFTIAALVMAGAGLALVLRFRESDTPMAV